MCSLRSEVYEAQKWDKFNYFGDFFLLPLILLANFYYLGKYYPFDVPELVSFFMGFIIYGSIIEYGMHRYFYHGSIRKVKKLHLIHHKFPRSYVSSPPYVTAIIIFVFYLFFIPLLGPKLGIAMVGGITLGYLWYIIIHHLIHHLSYTNSSFLNYFKIEHECHHKHSKRNYCVSQPIWNSIYRKFSQNH